MVADEGKTDAPVVVCIVVVFVVLGMAKDTATAVADITCCSLGIRILFLLTDWRPMLQ